MSPEIEFYTREEAEDLGVAFEGTPLSSDADDQGGPPICTPDRVASWLIAHFESGSIEAGNYTRSCDVRTTNEKFGNVWTPTEILFRVTD